MKVFEFKVIVMEEDGIVAKIIRQRANHLQGAIRQIYQNRNDLVRIVRILED